MKLGQLLSLQGDDLLPPALREALADLRATPHFMPESQLRRVLRARLGRTGRAASATSASSRSPPPRSARCTRRTRDGRELA